MPIRRSALAVLLAVGAVALVGCQSAGPAGSAPAPTGASPSGPTASASIDDARVAAAVADLAARLGVQQEAVQAGELEAVTWPDGSLGCPQPDMMYTQSLVDGSRLILTAEGAEYAYHGAATGPLVLCADPSPPVG